MENVQILQSFNNLIFEPLFFNKLKYSSALIQELVLRKCASQDTEHVTAEDLAGHCMLSK